MISRIQILFWDQKLRSYPRFCHFPNHLNLTSMNRISGHFTLFQNLSNIFHQAHRCETLENPTVSPRAVIFGASIWMPFTSKSEREQGIRRYLLTKKFYDRICFFTKKSLKLPFLWFSSWWDTPSAIVLPLVPRWPDERWR